ncbi:MAG: LLM class flavin-dependent oxidoreductase [Dehalococcoidia bacterium]
MKFQLFVLPTVPGILEDGERLRPIARNNERFQQMLDEVRQVCILGDELGYDCFSTTEHHFHSEGYECSVAPLVLYANLAALTKRIKFAPLGLVLPSWDPIRCAEEIAMLDHLTKGRVIAGFARGYQDRWVSVMGQQYRAIAAQSDESAGDTRNREIFEEMFHIIKKAWTEDAFEYDGKYYKVPYPYKEGIRDWPAQKWTRTHGAPGELDEEGVIRKISVVPKPYQQPHPPIFNAFSFSESTIRWAAKEGTIPHIQISIPESFTNLCHIYQDTAAEYGRDLKLGESVGASRCVYLGKTYEEAYDLALRTLGWSYAVYYNQFGFAEGFRYPGEDTPRPLTFKSPEEATKRLVDQEYGIVGTVDDVKRKIESVSRCHADGELEWFGVLVDQGMYPIEEVLEQIEWFGTKVMPEFQG